MVLPLSIELIAATASDGDLVSGSAEIRMEEDAAMQCSKKDDEAQ